MKRDTMNLFEIWEEVHKENVHIEKLEKRIKKLEEKIKRLVYTSKTK